jgi:CrcB protein
VNLLGAFILGWLLTRLAERTAPSRYWRFLVGTGFCGAVTTFSTFQIETFSSPRRSRRPCRGVPARQHRGRHGARRRRGHGGALGAALVGVLSWAGVALFGALGAVARFRVDAPSPPGRRRLPAGILVVNLTGAFALGVLLGAAVPDRAASSSGTGFMGGYTTFSTWMVETERLGENGELALLLANLGVSMVLGWAWRPSAGTPGEAIG